MRQSIFFFRSWAYGYYEPREPLSREEAETIFKHAQIGEGFAALVDDPEKPTAFLDYGVNANGKISYRIDYLDDQLRTWHGYSFRQIRDERLFLDRAGDHTYFNDNREPDESLGQMYDEDGLIRFSRKRRGEDFRDTWKDRLTTLEYHYEPLPAFGEYDSILRLERDRPWEEQEPWSGPK
jgi:hypothetical protein